MRNRLASLLSAVALTAALLPTPAHAVVGEEDAFLAALVAQGAQSYTQAAQSLAVVQQQLQLARDVYSGIKAFSTFDPNAFLQGQQQYWLQQVPLASDVSSLLNDVGSNGLNGGWFDAQSAYSRMSPYLDAADRKRIESTLGRLSTPYDPRTALSVSSELERAVSNPGTRQQLLAQPDVATVSEGLFVADAAKADPKLLAQFLQQRAAAKEADYQAFKLYAESLGASPAHAQQLAAAAAGLSAQELARIDAKLAHTAAIEQLDRQEKAAAKAADRQETDSLWKSLEKKTGSTFAPPERGNVTWKDL